MRSSSGSSSKFISDRFHHMSSSNLARQFLGLIDDLRGPARRKHVAHAVHFLEAILDLVEQRIVGNSTHGDYHRVNAGDGPRRAAPDIVDLHPVALDSLA